MTFCSGILNLSSLCLVGFHAVTVRVYRLGRLKSVGLVVSKLEKPFDAHIAKDSSGEIEREKSKHIVSEFEVRYFGVKSIANIARRSSVNAMNRVSSRTNIMQKSESFENLIKEGQKKNEIGDTLSAVEILPKRRASTDEPVCKHRAIEISFRPSL